MKYKNFRKVLFMTVLMTLLLSIFSIAYGAVDTTPPTITRVTGNFTDDWTKEAITLTIEGADDAESGLPAEPYSFDGGLTWQAENYKIFYKNERNIAIKVRNNAAVANKNDPSLIYNHPIINITKIDTSAPTCDGTSIVNVKDDKKLATGEYVSNDVYVTVDNLSDNNGSGVATEAYSFERYTSGENAGKDKWQASNQFRVSSNQTLQVKVRDVLGNESDYFDVVVDNIDKDAPTGATLEGTSSDWQNHDVTLTITGASDDLSGIPEGYAAYSFNAGLSWQSSPSKTFTETDLAVIAVVRDKAGNSIIVDTASVKIDKIEPDVVSITTTETEWTNDDVLLKVNGAYDLGGSTLASKPYSYDGGLTWENTSSKTYTETALGVVVIIKDNAGNIYKSDPIDIKIEKTNPTITDITGNKEDWTKDDVTLTIEGAADSQSGLAEEPYSFDGGETWQKENNKKYTDNADTIKVWVKDNAGNIYKHASVISITKIDKTAPIANCPISYPTLNGWTSNDVTLTIENANDYESGLAEKAYSFEKDDKGEPIWVSKTSHTFDATMNKDIEVLVQDKVGNIATIAKTTLKIDKTAPEVTMNVSNDGETVWCNEDKFTLTVDAEDVDAGLAAEAYSFDGGKTWTSETSKEYTDNAEKVVVVVKDIFDNKFTSGEINIKFDTTAPDKTKISVTGNPENWTTQDVTLTITGAEDEENGSGLPIEAYAFEENDDGPVWTSETTKTYSKNTDDIIIKVRDVAGNMTTLDPISITKIDKGNPLVEKIEGNYEQWTRNNVVLVVTASDELSGVKEYSFDGGTTWQEENTKEFDKNCDVNVVVRDNAGLTTTETVKIEKIDKVILSLQLEPEVWNKEDNTSKITIKSLNKELAPKEGWTLADDKMSISKDFTKNETISEDKIYDSHGFSIDNFTYAIREIDKDAPDFGDVTVSTEKYTAGSVIVTVEDAKDLKDGGEKGPIGLAEEAFSFDGGTTWQAENSKEFTENQEGIKVVVRDVADNRKECEKVIDITNIYPDSKVIYQAHVQDIGWQDYVNDGKEAGTTGQNKKVEALKIALVDAPEGAKLSYQAHVQDIGWQDWVNDDEEAGTTGQNKKVEALKIKLEGMDGYTVAYRAHVQDIGWQDWAYDGEVVGTTGQNKKIEAIEIKIIPVSEVKSQIQYQAHVQDIGWQDYVRDGAEAGTTGQNKKIESLKIKLAYVPEGASIKYQAHVQDIGWQDWVKDGAEAGTTGQNKKIEALKIVLEGMEGYSVAYRAHVQDIGWQDWVYNGDIAGTTGQNKKVEAIEIKIIPTDEIVPSVKYQAHVQDIGWQDWVKDGAEAGTTGQSKKVEALKIELVNAPEGAKIKYEAHVQDIGWQAPVENGAVAGTTGENKKVEAIKISLEGLDGYSIEYRAHVQDIGWQDWVKDGAEAGTTGQNKKIEAIEIRLVKKEA